MSGLGLRPWAHCFLVPGLSFPICAGASPRSSRARVGSRRCKGKARTPVRDGKAGRGARLPSARCAPRPPAPASCSWAVQCPPPGQGSCDEAARAQGCSAPLEGSPGGRFTEGTQEGSVQRGTTRGKCVPRVDAGWTPRTPHVLAAVSGNRRGHRGPAGTEFPSVGKGGRWGQLHTSLTCPHSLVTSAV